MMNRRTAIKNLGMAAAAALLATARKGPVFAHNLEPVVKHSSDDDAPRLAPGTPNSPERLALIEAFRTKSAGLETKFEAREHKSDWTMPYRLFRPSAGGRLPLVIYLHGSGALGNDNQKQLGLGNIFGTRVWALPENQKRFPCYVVAPQTDRGWARYDLNVSSKDEPKVLPGLGEGNRLALEVIDTLRKEFSIDDRHIYITGQSMGGAGVWNMIGQRSRFFAAAIPCCGSRVADDPALFADTPCWAFHGDSDKTVPVTNTRDHIDKMRKAGGHPIYTEYAGVDHNCWEWAYTEPALVDWLFAQKRS